MKDLRLWCKANPRAAAIAAVPAVLQSNFVSLVDEPSMVYLSAHSNINVVSDGEYDLSSVQEALEMRRLKKYKSLLRSLAKTDGNRDDKKLLVVNELKVSSPVIFTEYRCGRTVGKIHSRFNGEQPLRRFLGSTSVAGVVVKQRVAQKPVREARAAMQDAYLELLSAVTVPEWYKPAIVETCTGIYELDWLKRFDVGHRTERYICYVHGWIVKTAIEYKGNVDKARRKLKLPAIEYSDEIRDLARNTLLVLLMYEAKLVKAPTVKTRSNDRDVPEVSDHHICKVEWEVAQRGN